jgi:hypothetical protein
MKNKLEQMKVEKRMNLKVSINYLMFYLMLIESFFQCILRYSVNFPVYF